MCCEKIRPWVRGLWDTGHVGEVSETHPPIESTDADAAAAPRFSLLRGLTIAMAGATIVVPLAAAAWMVRTVVTPQPTEGTWAVDAAVAVAAMAVAAWGSVNRLVEWVRPARRLRVLLEAALDGSAPIESLNEVGGGLESVSAVCRQLLRELKKQRAAVTELNEEMRQRVAHRTDALERKIGTLQLQAMRDPLTGLYNRRALEQELPRVLKLREESTFPTDVCLLMIDLDHFKELNDTLGHPAGDKLLRDVGDLIRSTLRGNEYDLGFRCGGDEFVVLLGRGNAAAGTAVAIRLDTLVQQMTKPLHTAHPVRMSIGIAAASEIHGPVTAATLIKTADERLYAEKAAHHRENGTAARRAG